jgi:hypothetical protein
MIEKLFDEIGKAYAENKKQYPSYLAMTHTTYGMVMYGKIPEGFNKRALDRDNRTILNIPVLFDEKIKPGEVKMLYCKKEFKRDAA